MPNFQPGDLIAWDGESYWGSMGERALFFLGWTVGKFSSPNGEIPIMIVYDPVVNTKDSIKRVVYLEGWHVISSIASSSPE